MFLQSSEAYRQSDPLAPLLFSLGMPVFLETLQERFGTVHQVMAYLAGVVSLSKSGIDTVGVAAEVARLAVPRLLLNRTRARVRHW